MRSAALALTIWIASCRGAPVSTLPDDHPQRDLEVRVASHPNDLSARRALAALAERNGQPAVAIAQLEAVRQASGLFERNWNPADRARLGRLLAARGRLRLARGASSARRDLVAAKELGELIGDDELRAAEVVVAVGELRHTDRATRQRGKAALARLWSARPGPCTVPIACVDASWRGATSAATATDRGALGRYLWQRGALAAGWDELSAWYAAAADRSGELAAAYWRAYLWWTPSDANPPELTALPPDLGCRFAPTRCRASELARRAPIDGEAIAHRFAAAAVPTSDPTEAGAWIQLALWRALRGEGSWGRMVAARVATAHITVNALPPPVRTACARLLGQSADHPPAIAASALDRLTIAAGDVLAGATIDAVRARLGGAAAMPEAAALVAIASAIAEPPEPAVAVTDPFVAAATAHVVARAVDGPSAADLARVIEGYRVDPAVGERLGRELVARAIDAAPYHGALAMLFGLLDDPARARSEWQMAVDLSNEPWLLAGLAESIARAGDPDAALIAATAASAWSGDPAPVWLAVARALDGAGAYPAALEASRAAIDLGASEVAGDALVLAAVVSRKLGRSDQASALEQRAIASGALMRALGPGDPTDADGVLATAADGIDPASVARLWTASRWNPRHVGVRAALYRALPASDPRRSRVVSELIMLAARSREAVRALRRPTGG